MGHESKDTCRSRMIISRTDFGEKKFSVVAWPAVLTDNNYLLFVLFSVNVLFWLNEILMFSLSCLSILFLFFLCTCKRNKKVFLNC